MSPRPEDPSRTDVSSLLTRTRDDGPVRDPVGPARAPHRVGRFVVIDEVGRGGMGVVYSAYDPDLDRRVALKLLHGSAHGHAEDTHRARARLLREAQAMAKLSHPNVATVYEVGTMGDAVFLAMELVEGQTLRAWMRALEPRGSWSAVVAMLRQAASGLAAAHRAGLVHRDFKPSNVLIDGEGRARVVDFGLALAGRGRSDQSPTPDGAPSSEERDPGLDRDRPTPLTAAGHVVGTPGYMPPEQLSGGNVDGLGDQFSLCVVLYEALYRQRPFAAGTSQEQLGRILQQGPATPSNPYDVPEWLHDIVLRGLSAKPSARFPSMEALIDALDRGTARKRRARSTAGIVAAAFLGIGAMWTLQSWSASETAAGPCEDAPSRLEGVWDDPSKAAIERAFASTALQHAPETWQRVQARLDQHAERWLDAERTVCEASAIHRTQSPPLLAIRQACLDHRLSQLRAHTTVLARSDPKVVSTAIESIDQLLDPAKCTTVETMQVELPLPTAPEDAARAVEIRQQLENIKALTVASQLEAAYDTATLASEEAEALGFLPLRAEAQLQLGTVQDERGAYETAALTLERALWSAEVGRHDALAVDIWNQRIRTVGYHLADTDHAKQMLPRLDAALERLGDDPLREAGTSKSLGMVAFLTDDIEGARKHFADAATLVERELGPLHTRTIGMQQNLGTALYRLGRFDEATEVLERALEAAKTTFGPDHSRGASLSLSLGAMALRREDATAAEAHYRRAIDLFVQSHALSHPDLATYDRGLGEALVRQGRYEDALTPLHSALDIERASLRGPDGHTSALLGVALFETGEVGEAIPHLELAIAADMSVTSDAHMHRRTAMARFYLAQALARTESPVPSRARVLAERAREELHEWPKERAAVETWLQSTATPPR
ncbi:MAG: serine/threonine-protein kinase [Myxococcota bacterium]